MFFVSLYLKLENIIFVIDWFHGEPFLEMSFELDNSLNELWSYD